MPSASAARRGRALFASATQACSGRRQERTRDRPGAAEAQTFLVPVLGTAARAKSDFTAETQRRREERGDEEGRRQGGSGGRGGGRDGFLYLASARFHLSSQRLG